MRGKCWMRWLAVAAASAICLGLVACDPEDLVSPRVEATRTDAATFPASGIPMIAIESSNGAVTVRGVPGQTDVRVTAIAKARGNSQDEANERVAAVSIHMEQQGGRILLAYRGSEQTADVRRYSGVAFEVTAPPTLDVHAVTSNGAIVASAAQGRFSFTTSNGEVSASQLVGDLHAVTSNGRMTIDRCQGALGLETSNGEITMNDVSATIDASTSNGAIEFSGTIIGDSNALVTSNGRISVAVSASASVEFTAATSAGSISSSLPLAGDTQGKEWLATLNAPATARIEMRTSNGVIRILALP
jgi:hypothetical protein